MDTSFMDNLFDSKEDEIDYSYVDSTTTQEEEYENIGFSPSVEITGGEEHEAINDVNSNNEISTQTVSNTEEEERDATTHKVPVWYFFDVENSTTMTSAPTRMQAKSLFELEFTDESFVELNNVNADETNVTQATFKNDTTSKLDDTKQGNENVIF